MGHDMLRAPSRLALFNEIRALKDLFSLLYPRQTLSDLALTKNGKHVVMLPGFGADNRYVKPMIKYIERHSHLCYDWGLGLNDAGLKRTFKVSDLSDSWYADPTGKAKPITSKEVGVPYLCTLATNKVRSLSESLQVPLVLIGWSLGGYIAREVARDLPLHVSQVITFGTPAVGGPKFTQTADSFRKQDIDIDWIAREIMKRYEQPIQQNITNIVAKHDGIVHRSATIDTLSPHVVEYLVNTTHMGLGFHYPLWKIILQVLANPPTTNQ